MGKLLKGVLPSRSRIQVFDENDKGKTSSRGDRETTERRLKRQGRTKLNPNHEASITGRNLQQRELKPAADFRMKSIRRTNLVNVPFGKWIAYY